MAQSRCIYLGVKGSVVALNPAKGELLWATHLKGSDFVNVALDGGSLYAATRGEIFCLDPKNGKIRWHNPLKGYGLGLVAIAGEAISQNLAALIGEKLRRDQEAAASGAAAASAS